MVVLPAPIIENKIPSQFKERGIIIPFTLNKALSSSDFSEMYLKIKTISTNIILGVIPTSIKNIHFSKKENYAIFNLNTTGIQEQDNSQETLKILDKLEIGQFYKAQIACVQDDNIGLYSTVGVFKYTEQPIIKCFNYKEFELNQYGDTNPEYFLGGVLNNSDITEKISNYKFETYDSENNLIDSTDFQIHDMNNDNVTIQLANGEKALASIDKYHLTKSLEPNLDYYIIYTIKTNNNLVLSSKPYWIKETTSITFPFPGDLIISQNNDEGFCSLKTYFNMTGTLSGSFEILRSDESSDFKQWDVIHRIVFGNKSVTKNNCFELYKDFSIEHKKKYQYAIRQYSENQHYKTKKEIFNILEYPDGSLYRDKITSNNFEDIFLYDGDRQLKIRFNPKVSSFKDTILEKKINTIGSQYPFFFKNGLLKYKEFPISGLISCQMDENQFFMSHAFINTDLTGENLKEERQFKLEVMNWLNNGKPKLFKSSTEGNYLIRLMKVSLKPTDKLGRMLHTFSATAVEIGNCEINSLKEYEIINQDTSDNIDISYNTIPLVANEFIQVPSITVGRISNGKFGEKISFILANQPEEIHIIYLGITGTYNFNINKNNPIILISSDKFNDSQSNFQYGYINQKEADSFFNKEGNEITNFKIKNYIDQYTSYPDREEDIILTILKDNNDCHVSQIEKINYLKIFQKNIQKVWVDPKGILYEDKFFKKKVILLSNAIYHTYNTNEYYILNSKNILIKIQKDKIDYSYKISLKENNNILTNSFLLNNYSISIPLEDTIISSLFLGNGLYLDISYFLGSYDIIEKKEENNYDL